MSHQRLIVLVVGAVIVALVVNRDPDSGVREVAHKTAKVHLHLTGSSIYEFHAATGQWPKENGDLAQTSLPTKSPYWRVFLDDEHIIVVWHKALKPDPKDNASQILAYYNKGLISEQGRSWVCWGDLRTEYIRTDDLRKYVNDLKD
jgi:hypothetical protein